MPNWLNPEPADCTPAMNASIACRSAVADEVVGVSTGISDLRSPKASCSSSGSISCVAVNCALPFLIMGFTCASANANARFRNAGSVSSRL